MKREELWTAAVCVEAAKNMFELARDAYLADKTAHRGIAPYAQMLAAYREAVAVFAQAARCLAGQLVEECNDEVQAFRADFRESDLDSDFKASLERQLAFMLDDSPETLSLVN